MANHSNGRRSTWARHNSVLDGHLDEVLELLTKLPGLVERNDKRLEEYEASLYDKTGS
jgi:hypothetical protein